MSFSPLVKRLAPDLENFDVWSIVHLDTHPRKVDMVRPIYRTELGLSYVLPVVKEVMKEIATSTLIDQNLYPPFGMQSFRRVAEEFALGENCSRSSKEKVLTVQTISRDAALRLISEIAYKVLGFKNIYIPSPIWEVYKLIFIAAGFSKVRKYRYYDQEKHEVDIDGMLEDIQQITSDSVVVLQACCHEPTGCDLTKSQWNDVLQVMQEGVFPIIDAPHLGLASGDPEEDAYPIRLFEKSGIEMGVVVAFTRNFLIFNNGIGAAMFLVKNKEDIVPLKSHVSIVIRGSYGMPPQYGGRIVSKILSTPAYYNKWREELKKMVALSMKNRNDFANALVLYDVPGDWEYIRHGTGNHTLTNLTDRQVQHLIFYYHIYVERKGIITVCGLNSSNIDYVAEAFGNTIREYPKRYDTEKYE